MFSVFATIASHLVSALITEKFLIRMIIVFGDMITKSTKNVLDDTIWKDYRESLNEQVKGN